VLFWLGRAKSNREIAAILNIQPATVGKHLEHIYPKLGVENRTAAASFAPENAIGVTSKHLTFD
jgi:DNA-binding CsgD family transcriptional regulator